MARYTGPKAKISRRYGEPIMGPSKALTKKNYPPGVHGRGRRSKKSEYALQLMEKQKVKYTYGVLERQFRNLFHRAAVKEGITGENLLKLLRGAPRQYRFSVGYSTYSPCRPSVSIS